MGPAFRSDNKQRAGAEEEDEAIASLDARSEVVASRKLKGPPVIIAERLTSPHSIQMTFVLTRLVQLGVCNQQKPNNIASEELENPSRVKVTHVRSNPMYGYARALDMEEA